jgi:hypothetical protein
VAGGTAWDTPGSRFAEEVKADPFGRLRAGSVATNATRAERRLSDERLGHLFLSRNRKVKPHALSHKLRQGQGTPEEI